MGDIAQRLSATVTGVDEARSLCHTYFYPVALEPLSTVPGLSCRFDAVVAGPLTLAALEYGAAIRMSQGDLETAYHVNIPLTGALQSVHRGVQVVADQRQAAVYAPHGATVLERWQAGSRVLCVKLDRAAVHAELESLLGHPVRGPIDPAAGLDVSRGPGLSWLRLLHLLATDLHTEDGLLARRPVAEGLGLAAVHGWLYAVGHRFRVVLAEPGRPAHPTTVQRAVDAIHADPAHPFTVTELATIAGVSVRALQDGFRRHLGITPLSLVRQVRLNRIRDDLHAAVRDEVTVAAVAHRWGVSHLGRFAGDYRAKFGESPSATLRGTR